MIGRLAWFFNLTKNETREQTNKRVETFISTIDLNRNVLIISHGFFMMLLVKELKGVGYTGNISTKMSNGKVYILENK